MRSGFVRMKIERRILKLLAVLAAVGIPLGMAGQNAANGVYGGYVGSDRWFAMMRSSAQNQAVMMSLGRTRDAQKLPADYVEFAGQIVFPDGAGNPFPNKRFPDLRIMSRDKAADPVERAPLIDEQGGFYTVFKKGQTYDVSWMYYFGSREQFASITIPANAARQYRLAVPYAPPKNAGETTPQRPAAVASPPPARRASPPPPNAARYDTSGLPKTPADFEEQQLAELVRDDGRSALTHDRLANYYEKRGDAKKAEAEREKARYWRDPGAYYAPAAPEAAPTPEPGRGPDGAGAAEIDTPPARIIMPERAASVAVVIGIGEYREKDIPPLPFARRDSETIAAYLQNVSGVRRENIKMLSDNGATRSDIEDAVEQWLPRRAAAASSVIFYYAGHGALDPATGETYLVPHEGHPDSPRTRMYPLNRLYEQLEALPAKDITIFLDSCFSGGGRSIAMRGRPIVITTNNVSMNSRKLAVLSAAGANQVSSDLDRAGHGLFTYFLLRGIRGEADTNRDGWVDLYELSGFVKSNVQSTAVSELNREQTPVLWGGSGVEARAKNLALFRIAK